MAGGEYRKPLEWVSSSLRDLRKMPSGVRSAFGFAIDFATLGKKHDFAKPLKGFGGGSVLEVVEDDDGNTYRAVYTVKFASAVCVLDVFQKNQRPASRQKSTTSIESRAA
jgi:phage-related protein